MKTALKVLALGAAIAASATMAKADTLQLDVHGCDTTHSSSCSTTGGPYIGILYSGTPYGIDGVGSYNVFNSGSLTFSDVPPSAFISYTVASGFQFTISDTNGWKLVFTSDQAGEHNYTIPGDASPVDFYDAGSVSLFDNGVLEGTESGYVTAGSNGLSYFTGGLNASATPEPSSLALLGTGLLGMAGMARRRFMGR